MESSFLGDKKTSSVISIVATKSNTGKTTLIESLITIFKERGYSVGVLKHDAHKFEIDKEGKDSYRFTKAGADKMIISSKEKLAMVESVKEERAIDEILNMFGEMDLIIIEGFKNNKYPKIEVHRKDIDSRLLCKDESFDINTFLAIATDENLNLNIPELNIDDTSKVADFIESKIIKEK